MALDLDWSWSVELGRAAPRLTSRRRWKLYVVAWARHVQDGILAGPWALGGRGGVGEPGLPEGAWDTHTRTGGDWGKQEPVAVRHFLLFPLQ